MSGHVPYGTRLESHPSIPVLYRTLSLNTDLSIEGIRHEPTFKSIDELGVSIERLCRELRTDRAKGVSSDRVKEMQAKFGANILSPPRPNYFKKFLSYLFGGFNFLMWISATLVFISWQPLGGDQASVFQLGLGIILLADIVISTFFYALVDYKASRAMQSIQSLVAYTAHVVRDGEHQQIDAEALVRGDLVYLTAGQRVPADLRLIDISSDARFDRSILTGESKPIPATINATSGNPLESRNMALSSTFLARGSVRGIVIKIGNDTVIGHILKMSISRSTKSVTSPIQKDIHVFTIGVSCVAVFFFTLALAVWGGWIQYRYPKFETVSVAIVNAIGCLIAFVPQGLPICFALALTIIARRMAKQNVLVKNLNMVETLGCISVLCSDKTGTLTQGKMAVDSVMFIDQRFPGSYGHDTTTVQESTVHSMIRLLRIARLCNDAVFQAYTPQTPIQQRPVSGDATDTAILIYAESTLPFFPAMTKLESVFSLAFNSKNKYMAKIMKAENGDLTLFVKGAPDFLLQSSGWVMQSDGTVMELDDERNQELVKIKGDASRQGNRVIALCEKRLEPGSLPIGHDALETFVMEESKHDLLLVGLLALKDPPRQEVPGTVSRMRHAGIRVFMVTGDFELTACSIASSVGIISVGEEEINHVSDLETIRKSDPLPPYTQAFDLRPKPGSPHRAIVINGPEVESLLQSEWDYIAVKFDEIVFARTTPEQKLLIVENLQERGDNIVAVTGDGTNDAPALKAAHVGVSMGSGTDIAKEAAAMILLDNTFSSLLVGIENGRLVFENLKKVLLYLMPAGTYTEFIAVASNSFLGMQIPLSAFQQVLFCISNDLIMSISLMHEKPEASLMDRPPRNARTEKLTDWKFFVQVYLIIGPIVWISCMGMWFLYMSTQGLGFYDLILAFDQWRPFWKGHHIEHLSNAVITGQCVFYATMAICQIGTLFAIRNRTVSMLQSNFLWGPRQNLFILFSISCSIAICLIIFYGYWIQEIFSTGPIPINFWFIPFGFLTAIVLVDEIRKYIVRNFPHSPVAKIAW